MYAHTHVHINMLTHTHTHNQATLSVTNRPSSTLNTQQTMTAPHRTAPQNTKPINCTRITLELRLHSVSTALHCAPLRFDRAVETCLLYEHVKCWRTVQCACAHMFYIRACIASPIHDEVDWQPSGRLKFSLPKCITFLCVRREMSET